MGSTPTAITGSPRNITMSMLEQLPEDLRRYRDLKDEIARLEAEVKPLRESIIDRLIDLKATEKEMAYRVPGLREGKRCSSCGGEGYRYNENPCNTCQSCVLTVLFNHLIITVRCVMISVR